MVNRRAGISSEKRPSEFGARILKETKWNLGCNGTGAEYSEGDIDRWKTWTLDRNGPPCATGSTMRTSRVGAKARVAVDRGPGDISSRHGSGVQVQSGRGLIQSGRALVQSSGKVIQSNQPLVQSSGLLVRGSAGLQVRVAVIKRTRLDPLPSDGPLAAATINSREHDVTTSQGENPRSHPSQRRPSLARAAARGGSSSAGVTQETGDEKRCPGAMRGVQTGPETGAETGAGARGCFLGSKAEPTPRKTRRKIRLSGVRGRGQLQLSIQPEGDGLDIHIYQARGLLGRNCGSCDTYVKLSLIPDVDHNTRRKTPTVVNSKYPEYNQHFALNVDAENLLKRLQVTVWRRRASPSSEFLGCMSFGIRSLLRSSKSVIGWYYLLGAELGRTKHLKVASQESRAITPANRAKARLTCDWSVLQVSIMRGNDGFGFTICSDSPVRVQSVEPGGPGHQAGLQQGDCVLQMNGVPVESWQCVDLAHAIRSSTQIVLVVWRGQPELKPSCAVSPASTTVKKLLPHPPNSKHGRRRGQSSGVRSRLGSLWREEETNYPTTTTTTTLKGTRVTSSNGDNYIILSPVNPGSQMLQTVYQDENGTIGRLYQTHPTRGLHQQEPHFHQQPPMEWTGGGHSFKTTTLPPPSSSTSLVISQTPVLSGCYNNYQNCTMVQSHVPCSSYGTYGPLAPKTLIFPVFVQPLDLCSADRTLLMAEEMVLHQGSLQPSKVTVLIYTDLILLTREDEAGRCNVLQSPLYLHNIRLHYVSSEPLRLYLAHCVCEHWECDLSLEAFSLDQKTRVSLCLHDNITQQLAVPVETPHSNQVDLPLSLSRSRDLSLLSLGQLDLSSRPSSPYATFSDLPLRSSSPPPPHPPPPHPPPPHFLPFSPERCGPSPSPWILASPQEPPSKRNSYPPVWKEREGRGGGREAEGDRVTERVCGRSWKGRETRREREQEREERQAGEGQSVSEASESIWGGDSAPLSCCSSPLPPISPPPPYDMVPSTRKTQHGVHSTEDEEEEEEEEDMVEECTAPFRLGAPRSLQRSLSEGSLLQEPRSPYFLSDSTIHRLTRPLTSEPDRDHCPPSPHTLRRELTREGGSLQQMFQFLNGIKDRECKYGHQKRKKSLAEDIRSRMAFLRRQNHFNANSLERAFRNNRPPLEEVLRWADSFEALLSNKYGMAVFRHFLRSEFSEENLDFWLAVDKYKKTRTLNKMATRAHSIFNEFISTSASRQVNVDSSVREVTNQNLRQAPGPASFQLAQEQIYSLMERDSYPRFLKSLLYSQLANQKPAHAQMDSQNERGSTKSCNGIGPTSLASQSEQKTLI
ncbi:unnamed protein product [Lota lota]